jgi:PAS domain S-box-containing protein
MEEELNNYRNLCKRFPDIIYRLDTDGKITFINDAVKRYGYSPDEVLGKDMLDFIHPEDRQMALHRIKERRQVHRGDKQPLEIRLIPKTRNEKSFEILSTAIFEDPIINVDSYGLYKNNQVNTRNFLGTQGVARDITQRKLYESSIKHVASSVSFKSGEKFFDIMMLELQTVLKSDITFIGSFGNNKKDTIKTHTLIIGGQKSENFEYKLKDSPFETGIGRKICSYESGVSSKFPEDKTLKQMKIEGYIGIPLSNSQGEPVGLMVSLYRKPIQNARLAESILKIFASRVESELERFKTENKLLESEEKYRSLVEEIPSVVWTTSQSGETTYISPNVEKIYGFTQQEIYDDRKLWVGRIHPDDKKMVIMAFNALIGENKKFDIEYRIQRKDGEWIWIHDIASKSSEKEGTSFAHGSFSDITDRKKTEEELRESEEKFRSINDAAHDAIIMINYMGLIISWNKAAQRMFGYKKEEVIGQPIEEFLIPERYRQAHLATFPKFKGKKPKDVAKSNLEIIALSKTGKEIPIEISIAPVELEGKWNVIGIIRDITERKEAEDERRKLGQQLSQAQKMEAVGTLAGGIAHDFNNILGAILGFSELALRKLPKTHPIREDIESVYESGIRAKDLVKRILAFSRRTEKKYKPLQLEPIVEEAIKFLRSSLPTTIDIVKSIEKQLEDVSGDPTEIYQVIMNLCTNAMHTMEEGGGTLGVHLSKIQIDHISPVTGNLSPGNYLKLNISDTGKGIEPEIIERIFEPFFTTKEVGKGTGLGLSVVHGLIKNHGGSITVTSEPGLGSTFSVYLPICSDKSKRPLAEPKKAKLQGDEHILLVEDEELLANMITRTLEEFGYRVTTQRSALAALEKFIEEPHIYHLVVTDQTMSKMKGTELSRKIKGIRSDIPIILISGYGETIGKKELEAAGIQTRFSKPFNSTEFLGGIRVILDRSKRI